VDVAYSRQNVKIFGVSGGVSYGALGASHHSLHDIAVFRSIPDISVILPCDASQTKAMLLALEQTDAPAYIRAGRGGVPAVYDGDAPFTLGKANLLREGTDLTIIACGETVYHAQQAAALLEQDGVSVRVLDMHTLKPLDEEAVIAAAKETGRILTVEEHNVNGGLGASVAQIAAANHPIRVVCLAFPDETLVSGTSEELFAHYGLNQAGIYKAAKHLLTLQ